MAGYAQIINIDKVQQPYSNYLWSFLSGHNRLVSEVTDWTKTIVGIPNSSDFGLFINASGDFTVFRKHKTDGTPVNFANVIIDCAVSTKIVFYTIQPDPEPNFNFKVSIELAELGGNSLANIEYGYSQISGDVISNWQPSPVFDINDEGVYYFDVRVIGSIVTVGEQLVELYLSNSGITTGGDENDNPVTGTSSSED